MSEFNGKYDAFLERERSREFDQPEVEMCRHRPDIECNFSGCSTCEHNSKLFPFVPGDTLTVEDVDIEEHVMTFRCDQTDILYCVRMSELNPYIKLGKKINKG